MHFNGSQCSELVGFMCMLSYLLAVLYWIIVIVKLYVEFMVTYHFQ